MSSTMIGNGGGKPVTDDMQGYYLTPQKIQEINNGNNESLKQLVANSINKANNVSTDLFEQAGGDVNKYNAMRANFNKAVVATRVNAADAKTAPGGVTVPLELLNAANANPGAEDFSNVDHPFYGIHDQFMSSGDVNKPKVAATDFSAQDVNPEGFIK